MYSKKIESILKRNKIKIGDRILLKQDKKHFEGLLMPQYGDPDTIVLKLDNGYNIGLKFSGTITKSKHSTPREVKKEEKYELGRVSKDLLKLKFDPKKPPISIISTGGTISSRIDYKTGAVTGLEDPREFLHNVPELSKIVNVRRLDKPFTKMSEDMDHKDWIKIAENVARNLNAGDKGVIVTHGTDALHFTAAALSFFLKNLSKPVVLVGAQRSTDRGSSDAGMNLLCAAHACLSDIAEVGICMHGSINDDYCLFNRGTKVRKMDTQRRDAFRPINEKPLALVFPNGKIIKENTYKKRTDKKVELDTKFEPRVAIIKSHPMADPSVIDYYVSKGYRGFVLETMGLGHVPTNGKYSWIATIKKHVKKGIPFVSATGTIYGRINPNVYSNLRKLYQESGAISLGDMTVETAFVKLGWILGHTKDFDKVKEMMLTNYAGEMTSRTLPETFLY